MVLSTPILALLCCSAVVCGLTTIAAFAGLMAVAGWDHRSSDRRQLLRERRWFLVETSLRLILGLADRLGVPMAQGAVNAAAAQAAIEAGLGSKDMSALAVHLRG